MNLQMVFTLSDVFAITCFALSILYMVGNGFSHFLISGFKHNVFIHL